VRAKLRVRRFTLGKRALKVSLNRLDVSGVDTTNLGLGLHQQATRCAPIPIRHASLDVGEAFALVPFDHLDDVQFRPGNPPGRPPSTAVLGGKQLFEQFGVSSKAIDSNQNGLNDTSRGLSHFRHDLQEEMFVPMQRYSAPNEQAGKDAQGGADPGYLPL